MQFFLHLACIQHIYLLECEWHFLHVLCKWVQCLLQYDTFQPVWKFLSLRPSVTHPLLTCGTKHVKCKIARVDEATDGQTQKKPWREPPRQYPSLLYGFLIRSRRRSNVSIDTMIYDIIIYISLNKLTSTDQHWQSYGPASFDFKTRHRYIELCRPVTRWISVQLRLGGFCHAKSAMSSQ